MNMIDLYLTVIIGALFAFYYTFVDFDYQLSLFARLFLFPFVFIISSFSMFIFVLLMTEPWKQLLSLIRNEAQSDEINIIGIVLSGILSIFLMLVFFGFISYGVHEFFSTIKAEIRHIKFKMSLRNKNNPEKENKIT